MKKLFSSAAWKNVPRPVWILGAIILGGIFLRTYHFHDWLYFYPDQARDVMLTENVLNGKSSWPLMGPIAASTQLRIGPMYYYFQIISGKIFGVRPETMAYPDLFFSILSIPLLYFFLKRYFSVNLSLALTGLYAVSFYAIRYSRFAWNPNPIPFFILLFLLSMSEFLFSEEKTRWIWIISIGISLGVGIQLQTILLILLPATSFIVFLYLLKKNWKVWNKWAVIFAIAVILNAGPIISETRTGFSNTKLLFNISTSASSSQTDISTPGYSLEQEFFCYVQANIHISSSLGDKDHCNFLDTVKKPPHRHMFDYTSYLIAVIFSALFSIFGYGLLVYRYKKEKERKKKYFLGLIILFSSLSFLVMFPVIEGISLRYFIYLIFIPFIFIGFLIQFLAEIWPRKYLLCSIFIFVFFISANFFTLGMEAKEFFAKDRSVSNYVVLGEIEPMADFMASESGSQKTAYLKGEREYVQNFFKPLMYLEQKRGVTLLGVSSKTQSFENRTVFHIGQSKNKPTFDAPGYSLQNHKIFGQNSIYVFKK